ncbi:hypothetical protein QCA50_011109 [Cerrena zonata]|uniref:Dipeptidyl aminopeptidase n=1 Tax=Cerrena zonata TaxID=2478898 RepID=A0AAW0FW77_9APHY
MPPAGYSPVHVEQDDVFTDEPRDSSFVRPPTYYEEGPFDPPSSDDEEDAFLEKNTSVNTDMEGDGGLVVGGTKKRPSSLRCLVISLGSLVATAAIIGMFAAFSYTGTSYRVRGTKHITMDHIFNGTFRAQSQTVRWVPEAGDGVFATTIDGHITLVDLKTNSTRNLVSMGDIKDEHGNIIGWGSWELSSDMELMLIKADYVKQWRHSSFGNYYIHNLTSHQTYPLITPSYPPTTVIANWSPTGQSVAFVTSSDLYVLSSPSASATPIRVTSTGNSSLFNGITDWVYEEEVFSSPTALWWSPDSAKLAFLSFDETTVDEFTFPVYNPSDDSYAVVPYPDHVTMKYPKPGYNNPLVSIHIFEMDRYLTSVNSTANANMTEIAEHATLELDWNGRQPANNSVIAEVAWVGDAALLVKEVNRAADNGSVILFDLHQGASNHGEVIRILGKNGEQGDEGWIDSAQNILPLTSDLSSDGIPAYLDIVPTKEGYNHIALFRPASNHTPQFLTEGKWEVTDTILAVDPRRNLIYFRAANPSSTERHIYSVPLPTGNSYESAKPSALTDNASPGYYDANFSPKAGFYLLNYQGPSVPWQKVIQTEKPDFNYVLTDNTNLNNTIAEFETPIITYSTIDSDGYELNVREIRPPRMDDSGKTKYPVLFQVYGGPFSQQVDLKFNLDWHHYIACSLKYIVVTVDGRGTGFKGRKLRNPVKDNLGHWETRDQINAAKIWAAKEYVDPKRIGIWGWSYGGFMSSKVVEADAGVHSLAMAVAPVTSWRLYDSIYTERYMNLPQVNPSGYVTASISNVTAFNKVDFLLAHGSGDDNVHYANSAHMLDMFTAQKIRNFRFRMFTDSDHSIGRRGAYRELYEFLTQFLIEKWGKGARQRGW